MNRVLLALALAAVVGPGSDSRAFATWDVHGPREEGGSPGAVALEVALTEGTNMAAALSPDGET
ncbi:MAG: hypothetical protein HKO53_20000, partial [Gemmatimonadetes bacterium]|nr:hypothetical protein [Gemmatimonadota bacterium]